MSGLWRTLGATRRDGAPPEHRPPLGGGSRWPAQRVVRSRPRRHRSGSGGAVGSSTRTVHRLSGLSRYVAASPTLGRMSYAGDIEPKDAYAVLGEDEEAVLVDVRTTAEWNYVGLPDLTAVGKRVLCVEWQRFPDGAVNERFVEQLQGAGLPDGAPLYFLCRSGVRSIAAAEAATAAGLGPAYNVLHGFEGHHDREGHRSVAGWKNDGLPWRQG